MKNTFRAFHYDIARGSYLTNETFCTALRLAARSGFTHFIPYLENMIRLPAMAQACPSCAYTADDWQKFETVARAAGIELVPHFNVIGHLETICPAYPELGGRVDRGHLEIDPERAVTRAWTLRCLEEFCQFSHSEYFLIGGDEWQPPQQLLARTDFEAGTAWVNQINCAVACLAQHGRKPIVWHDMLIHYPRALESLSRSAVIAFWFYDYDSDYPALEMFRQHGFMTLMATAAFGGATATIGRRSLRALQCAAAAAQRHQCAGTIVTTWEISRWEFQTFNIPMTAGILRGATPPAAIVDALSLFQAWQRLPANAPLAHEWRTKIEGRLKARAWDDFPDLHECIRAMVTGDAPADLASFLRFHHPLGHGYERVVQGTTGPAWPATVSTASVAQAFELRTENAPLTGDSLLFHNGDETFVVYPKFGATLQDWRQGTEVIIPNSIANFLKRNPLAGGYRSYNAAGGLRPIWALGTHSNPCILWQFPWNWKIEKKTKESIVVALAAQFSHVSVVIYISIARDHSGFNYEVRATNKLAHAYGAFNFNLPLTFDLEDLTAMKFEWQEGETTVAAHADGVFWIPARGALTVRCPRWTLQVDAPPDQTAGYAVDWGAGFVTPDLHGVYRKLNVGEETVTRWSFTVNGTAGRI